MAVRLLTVKYPNMQLLNKIARFAFAAVAEQCGAVDALIVLITGTKSVR